MDDTASRTNPFVSRTHSHPRERFQPPGVPNHYLTFITSYERRNFVGARFSHGTTVLRDTRHHPFTSLDSTKFPIRWLRVNLKWPRPDPFHFRNGTPPKAVSRCKDQRRCLRFHPFAVNSVLIGLYIIQVYKELIHTHRGTNVCNLVFGSVIAIHSKPFDNFVIGEKLIPQQFPVFPEIPN